MSEWIFNQNGQPKLLFDQDCLRNNGGQVIAWIRNTSVYTMKPNVDFTPTLKNREPLILIKDVRIRD